MFLTKPIRALAFPALLLAASLAWAADSPASSAVTVTYAHPENFSAMRTAPPSERSDVENNLAVLKRYIEKRAARVLAPGQHLSITITEVALAGQYEPWPNSPRGWMRVIRSMYPPRMQLDFTLRGADGKVLRHGSRTLTGLGFMGSANIQDSDPVRYTKAMVDRWLRKGPDKL